MNISLITGRIISEPIKFATSHNYFTELKINFPQMKNYIASAIGLADGEISKSIEKFYCKGDYVIIQGESLVVENNYKNSIIVIYISDIQPAHLIIQN